MGGAEQFHHPAPESRCQSSCHRRVQQAQTHPAPTKLAFGSSAGVVEASARHAGKRKPEQKMNNIDEWVLGVLAASTGTGVQIDSGRFRACLCMTKMRAASVTNTLRKSQKPLFCFAKTEFSF